MLYYERKLKKQGFDIIIGVDEAGRGPLAGPIVAAAVALKSSHFKKRIDDSKKLTALQRQEAYPEIVQKSLFGLGLINHKQIDCLNIYVATQLAMEAAVISLCAKLGKSKARRIHIIVDGNIKFKTNFPLTNIIGGDGKSKSIACASILAKVTRDRIMCVYDRIYPRYGFIRHKGYATEEHRNAIKKFGPVEIHRYSFLRCLDDESGKIRRENSRWFFKKKRLQDFVQKL